MKKVWFFSPMKPIDHKNPSGDREIARGLYRYFSDAGYETVLVSRRRSKSDLKNWAYLPLLWEILCLWVKGLVHGRPDFLFCYHTYYKVPDHLLWVLSYLLNRPYFIFEGMYSERILEDKSNWVKYFINRCALKKARLVFTDKRLDIPGLLKVLPEDKVLYVPPSVDTSFYSTEAVDREDLRHEIGLTKTTISCTAMLRPGRKVDGVVFLIECLHELKREGLDFEFCLVGDGEGRNEVLEAINQGPASIRFLGLRSKTQIRDLLCASDVFAFPGYDEGFGLVYTEAQSCELPVVAFRNGGVVEAVADGRSGILTAVYGKTQYKAALKKLVENSKVRKEMSLNARQFILSNHDMQLNYQRMLMCIEEQVENWDHPTLRKEWA